MMIWVDADACPAEVKHILFCAAERHAVAMMLVANSPVHIPPSDLIALEIVPSGPDIADDYIAEHCGEGDLVITADIPLAARVVEAGATGLNPRGLLYTEENIGECLALRNFMEEMRSGGQAQGGPSRPTASDNQAFANALDRFLAKALRNRG